MFTEDSAAGIVEESLQPGSLRLGASRPDDVAIVKERENVDLRRGWGRNQERRRRRLTLWDTPAQTVLMWSGRTMWVCHWWWLPGTWRNKPVQPDCLRHLRSSLPSPLLIYLSIFLCLHPTTTPAPLHLPSSTFHPSILLWPQHIQFCGHSTVAIPATEHPWN